jgi:ABC-2 type transport system ATP-binding protein
MEVSGVSRRFGTEQAVQGVDLTVIPGEIHALVGLNGAGKTTLMRLMLGMLRADAGSVTVRVTRHDGSSSMTDVRTAAAETWADVGHLIETPFAYAELTVEETIRAAAMLRGLSRSDAGAAARVVITELALDHWAARRSRTLSLGNRQRVGLACAMVHRPALLVLDEPANALDPAGVLGVRGHLLAAADRGVAILVSSHHLDEVARLADRITVMHRGAVVGCLDPGALDLERRFFDLVYAADGLPSPEAGRRRRAVV